MSDSTVAKVAGNLTSLLSQHPQGGVGLMTTVRTLAGSDVRTVDALIGVAKNATIEQKADIAAGLANTATTCAWTHPNIAATIQQKVVSSGDAPLSTAFLGVMRAIGTAALGGGGGPGREVQRVGGARGSGGTDSEVTGAIGRRGRTGSDTDSSGGADWGSRSNNK
jgi:hypothetical protein